MNFHKDELVWRDDKHQHDHAMTWLTSIESEDEFERMVMLVRWGRYFSGNTKTSLKNWEARRLRVLGDKVVVGAFFFLLTLYDRVISCSKKVGYPRERPLFGRENTTSKQ